MVEGRKQKDRLYRIFPTATRGFTSQLVKMNLRGEHLTIEANESRYSLGIYGGPQL
jgi:hypothetical protein